MLEGWIEASALAFSFIGGGWLVLCHGDILFELSLLLGCPQNGGKFTWALAWYTPSPVCAGGGLDCVLPLGLQSRRVGHRGQGHRHSMAPQVIGRGAGWQGTIGTLWRSSGA